MLPRLCIPAFVNFDGVGGAEVSACKAGYFELCAGSVVCSGQALKVSAFLVLNEHAARYSGEHFAGHLEDTVFAHGGNRFGFDAGRIDFTNPYRAGTDKLDNLKEIIVCLFPPPSG